MLQIINLGWMGYGVYSTNGRGPFGTPLVFRGSLDECLGYRRQQKL